MQDNDFSAYKELYLKAARDNMQVMKEGLVLSRQRPHDSALIDEMHRAAHNLRTESLLMRHIATAALCGAIENIFYKVKTKALSLSPAISDAIAGSITQLTKSFDMIEQKDQEIDLVETIGYLKKAAETT